MEKWYEEEEDMSLVIRLLIYTAHRIINIIHSNTHTRINL